MKRTPMPRATKPMRRSRIQTRRGDNKDWWKARSWVLNRDNGRCQASAIEHDCTGRAVHAHHVKPRGRGGSDDPTNLIGVCEAGHAAIHARPERAHALGLLVHSWEKPETA